MQIEKSDGDLLLAEVKAVFPPEEMPLPAELTISEDGWGECIGLRDDLDAVRGEPITSEIFRLIHQDLRCLSEKGLRWILPDYLRYCISAEGQRSRMETEFLVYYLSPNLRYRDQALLRLRFLSRDQIECLYHFLDWCSDHPHWRDYFPEDLQKAKEFILQLLQRL